MRTDAEGSTNHMHWHDGSTCHGSPTLDECATEAIRKSWNGRVLERVDVRSNDSTEIKCYSLIAGHFDHHAQYGKFVAEVKLSLVVAKELKLFVVYLGGKVAEGRMGEDHEVVVVVADDVPAARKAAKAKWCGIGDPHVDAVQELDIVDKHKVCLSRVVEGDRMPVDSTWVP